MNCASKVIQKNLTFGMQVHNTGEYFTMDCGRGKVDGNLK